MSPSPANQKATPASIEPRWYSVAICLALVAVTAWLYWPVHTHEFITLDDQDYLVTNSRVQAGITADTVHWAFTQSYAGNWHPLTWISHMLDCQWFGLRPAGHHVVNLFFHVANAVLLFLLFRFMTHTLWRSAFVAALFALHPLHVESVAWAAERKDVLSMFFFILTLMAYVRYAKPANQASKAGMYPRGCYALSLVLFALGLMSKSMLVTLPFVLVLLDFWPLRRLSIPDLRSQNSKVRKLVLEKIPFFALSVASCGLTLWAQSAGKAVGTTQAFPLADRIANSLTACLGYIEKTFWPVNLSIFYPFPTEARTGMALIALLLLGAVTLLAVLKFKTRPYLLIGWLWYLGTLVPVIGLVQVGSQAMADRYTYLPLVGVFIMVAWGAAEALAGAVWPKLVQAAALLFLTVCGLLTSRQVAYWQNNQTLFGHALFVNDQDYLTLAIQGDLLRQEGKYEQAAEYSRRAVKLRPNSEVPWYGLALTLKSLNKLEESENAFLSALKLSPANAYILNDYARLLIVQGRMPEADEQLQRARQANPYLTEPRLTKVMLLQQQGRLDEAVKECQAILELDPANETAHVRVAAISSVLGKPDQAVLHYRQALRINPANLNARIGLGLALIETHDLVAAESEFLTVLKAEPKNASALDGLGVTLSASGRLSEAIARFTESLRFAPDNPDTHIHYAMTLTADGQPRQAVREYQQALDLDGGRVFALNNLAWILAAHPDPTIRDGRKAVELAERACQLTGNNQPFVLGTLAAAYAEAGRFPEAIVTAQKATDLASQAGIKELADRNARLMELYQAGKAYHEPVQTK